MAVFVIGYDLHPSKGETYDDLLKAIPKVGTSSWHCIDSTWLVVSDKTAAEIRNELKAHLLPDDQLLVVKYGKGAAWFGFAGKCNQWLVDNL
ncbi:MAG: hypothetical protein K2X60_10345 [Xanthobacteraceae bacterium]|nr:hypothetical protein [Xanthobacteraceae bacterium]